ncbi:MAG TPA: histidine kinase [Solirubrobacteraceae bacterium]|nr:histidine kinase [Solirubrobacteraceae bacterium]
MKRVFSRESYVPDAIVAAIFAVVGLLDAADAAERVGPPQLNAAAALALAGLVLVRRRWALSAGYGFLALLVVMAAGLTSPAMLSMPLFGLLLFGYSVGAHGTGPLSRAWPLACLGVITLVTLTLPDPILGDVAFPGALAVAAFVTGRAGQGRLRLAAELHEAALLAAEAREAEARRAVAAERRRIAREMHDVVAHSISVMVVQAGGARRILAREPERAEAAAAEIERTGREALLEMRRLLGVLRGPDEEAARAPAPGFDGLSGLVARARDAGLPVELRIEGEPAPLAPGVDLAAYRVVQEALLNALQHAPGAPTEVRVCWTPDALELHVADRGPGPAEDPSRDGNGNGLIGMRERVCLYGGELQTGRRSGGGFEVRARLPFDAADDSSVPPGKMAAQGAA